MISVDDQIYEDITPPRPKANGSGKDSESAAPFVLFDKIDTSPKEWAVQENVREAR